MTQTVNGPKALLKSQPALDRTHHHLTPGHEVVSGFDRTRYVGHPPRETVVRDGCGHRIRP